MKYFIIAVSLSVSLSTASIADTTILNPGFEDGWLGWQYVNPTGKATSLSEVAHEGVQSAKIAESAGYISQVVQVSPDTEYRLRAFLRGAGTVGVKTGGKLYFEQGSKVKEWKPVDVSFISDGTGKMIIFAAFLGKEGRFDDFSLSLSKPGTKHSPSIIPTKQGGYGLSPDLPPGKNFDLTSWYLNTPADADLDQLSDRFSEKELVNGYQDADYFYTAKDGGMVFRATVAGAKTSKNTRYTRSELREMLRSGNTAIKTRSNDRTPNKNNWVFSSAPEKAKRAAGAVDGRLQATLKMDHVTTTGDINEIGQVVIGQIHAADDEPLRLYYRKLPGHTKGSIYAAHEISGADDIYFNILGDRAKDVPDPIDGIALGEKFSYDVIAQGNDLSVSISQNGKELGSVKIDMSNSGYDVSNDFLYFKAGVYNQNKTGKADDYVQATFYELKASHDEYGN